VATGALEAAVAPLRFRAVWLAAGWVGVALVVYLSLTPDPPPPGELLGFDFAHAVAYASLMFWFAQLYEARGARAAIALALCAMGVTLELLQGLTEYRTFSYPDMRDDAIGVALGLVLAATRLSAMLPQLDARLAQAAARRGA
jgi:VanZ family protein